jgi:putative copper export protein
MTKLRTTLTFVVAVQVALVLAAAGHATPDKGDAKTTTTTSTLDQPGGPGRGFHRGG